MTDVKGARLVQGYATGLLGRMTLMEALYYDEKWQLGPAFEAVIASGLAEFFSRFDDARDTIFRVVTEQEPIAMGTLALDVGGRENPGEGALRWFFLHPELHGLGLGKRLMEAVLSHAQGIGLSEVVVETFEGLDSAIAIYEAFGFQLEDRWEGAQWGRILPERRYRLVL